MPEIQTKSDPLQQNSQTISEFIRRTDELADRKGLILSEIAKLLGISKAMLFGYRSGKNRITAKVWLKLERAERAAFGKVNEASDPPGIAESSSYPNDPGIGETAHVLREDPAVYRTRRDASNDLRPPLRDQFDDGGKLIEVLQRIAEALEKIVENQRRE